MSKYKLFSFAIHAAQGSYSAARGSSSPTPTVPSWDCVEGPLRTVDDALRRTRDLVPANDCSPTAANDLLLSNTLLMSRKV